MREIKNLPNGQLGALIQSPYDTRLSCWKHDVQLMINQVVRHYFQLPRDVQNSISIMKLIDTYRKNLELEVFESLGHYCIVLAKITDHLLQFLYAETKQMPQLYFYHREKEVLVEWDHSISLNIYLTESSNKLYSMRKYLLEADEPLIERFQKIMEVYSIDVFGKLPDKIQIVTLLDGKLYEKTPTPDVLDLVNNRSQNYTKYKSWERR